MSDKPPYQMRPFAQFLARTLERIKDPNPEILCGHRRVQPQFDEKAAHGLSAHEVRRRWPRFSGVCPDCRESVILYASFSHYVAGDW